MDSSGYFRGDVNLLFADTEESNFLRHNPVNSQQQYVKITVKIRTKTRTMQGVKSFISTPWKNNKKIENLRLLFIQTT